jgi:sensor histidine kinase YesM
MSPTPHGRAHRLRRLAWRGVLTLGISGIVAAALSLLLQLPLRNTLAYSVCVSIGCWLFIDGGRMLAAHWVRQRASPETRHLHEEWPGWGWMSAVIGLGTLLGFSIGHELASRLLGRSDTLTQAMDFRAFATVLLLSSIPSIAATYFFHTRGRLAKSLAQAEQAERLAAEQRLQLLASQLEPHMLFNTLANLRVLIGVDPPRAQAMLDRLIAFLRSTLSASRSTLHPLATEFERVGDYLALMGIRMGSRLQTQLLLPDALRDVGVPPLLLQPLMENSIKHGLEPKVAGGRIEVSARRDGEMLVLSVHDSGIGLGASGLPGDTHFGLQQVRERLRTLYGSRAALELQDAAGGGTLAQIRLPLDA